MLDRACTGMRCEPGANEALSCDIASSAIAVVDQVEAAVF